MRTTHVCIPTVRVIFFITVLEHAFFSSYIMFLFTGPQIKVSRDSYTGDVCLEVALTNTHTEIE